MASHAPSRVYRRFDAGMPQHFRANCSRPALRQRPSAGGLVRGIRFGLIWAAGFWSCLALVSYWTWIAR